MQCDDLNSPILTNHTSSEDASGQGRKALVTHLKNGASRPTHKMTPLKPMVGPDLPEPAGEMPQPQGASASGSAAVP